MVIQKIPPNVAIHRFEMGNVSPAPVAREPRHGDRETRMPAREVDSASEAPIAAEIVQSIKGLCHSAYMAFGRYMLERMSKSQANSLPIRPEMTVRERHWMKPLVQTMNEHWSGLGPGLEGVNFYTFAGPGRWTSPFSERSNPDSPYYQAWVGTYVVKDSRGNHKWLLNEDGSVDLSKLIRLAEFDQIAWLRHAGDPDPYARRTGDVREGTMVIDGVTRPVWEFEIASHSDLSSAKTQLTTFLGMPDDTGKLEANHDMHYAGYYTGWYDADSDAVVVMYAAASQFQTSDGTAVDNFTEIKNELQRMMAGTRLLEQ